MAFSSLIASLPSLPFPAGRGRPPDRVYVSYVAVRQISCFHFFQGAPLRSVSVLSTIVVPRARGSSIH